MQLTFSRLFLMIAFVLFLLAALTAGGVIGAGNTAWLVPGGLAALTLGLLL